MNNMNNKEYYEDEINLRDYVEVILKYKWLIIGIFLASVIITAIVSLNMPKTYEATTAIMITPSKIQRTLSPGEISLSGTSEGGKISLKSAISITTHKELLKSNNVLQRVIDKLDLVNEREEKISPYSLAKKLDIKRTEETNLLQLKVKYKESEMAEKIANTWAEEYIDYAQEIISGEVKSTGEFISKQFKIAKQNLIQSEEKIRNFKNKYNLDLIKSELHMRKNKFNNEKKDLIGLKIKIRTKQDLLKQLQLEIKKQNKYILISKAITDDALWKKIVEKDKGIGKLDKKKLTSEVKNPIYQNLEKRIVNTRININTLNAKIKYLKDSVNRTIIEIDKLKKTLYLKQFELTQLNRQLNIYKKTYNNLVDKIESSRIISAAQLDEVKIVSPAIIPRSPVSSKKKQKIAISGVVSLMLAVFLAFFIEFIRTSKPSKSTE